MEFRWAADGKTEELRQWLREHPERVNIPAKDSNMTLLYTCISNSNRTDLASLQAGCSSYFSMVRMLCEEYKADVLVPNGGTCNTALHLAASTGATRILRYLVEVLRTPVDCINAFGERPVQMAQRHGQAECTGILAAAAATVASTQSTPPAGARSTPLPVAAGGEQHNAVAGIPGGGSRRFQKVTVSDSDDDGGPSRDNDAPAPAAAAAALCSSGSGCRRPTDDTGSLSLVTQAIQHGDSSNNGSAPFAFLHGRSVSAVASEAHSPLHRRSPNEASSDKAPDIMGAPSMCPPFVSAAFSTPSLPVRPRSEYDISHTRIFANPDLQGFRTAYGDGFKYIRCSDHYEIHGILPYTYRGTVYYTPVLISVYAPTGTAGSSENLMSGGPAEGSSAGGGSDKEKWPPFMGPAGTHTLQATPPATHTMAKAHVYCRYRVCLNMRNLNGFAISRRAEYIDPISGAIIPAPGDDKYQTLTAYIRNVVVRNFEAVPPLIVPTSSYAFPERPNLSQLGSDDGTDVYHHHHSHNSPAFMKNALPKRSAAHIRCVTILRELSRFGDGLAQYCPSKHRIVAFVPIFSERKKAVLAVPQKRPCVPVPVHGRGLQPVVAHAAAAAATAVQEEGGSSVTGGKAGVTQQVAVEAVAELQVRVLLQFSPTRIGGAADGSDVSKDGGACVYSQPPRIYLVDAATSPLTRLLDGETSASAGATMAPPSSPSPPSLTAQCFACIIKDRETGEVFQEFLRLSHESWRASGSVYDILVELQRALRGVLESFAMSYTGRKAGSPAARQELQSSGSTHHVDGAPRSTPVVPSPLESFFMPPMAQIQPTMNDASRRFISAAPRSSVGLCLYCAQPLPPSRALLKPCGHDGLCGVCVQRLQSHCREEVFSCPVCRGAVLNVLEIFL